MTTAIIETTQFQSLLNGGERPNVLDVRTGAEFAAQHLPGSRNLPLQDLDDTACAQLAAECGERPLYILCGSGKRAAMARDKLAATSTGEMYIVEGGIEALSRTGANLATGEPC